MKNMKKQGRSLLIALSSLCFVGLIEIVGAAGFTPTPSVAIAQSLPDPAAALSQEISETDGLLPLSLAITSEAPELTPIYLDGRELFRLSAPALEDARAAGQPPTEVRAQEIQSQINAAAERLILDNSAATDPDADSSSAENSTTDNPTAENSTTNDPSKRSAIQPDVSVRIDEPSNLPVIFAGSQPLLTVTTLDAQFSGFATPSELAEVFRGRLERAFKRYVEERSPMAFRRQCQQAFMILSTAAIAQILIKRIRQRVRQRQSRLVDAQTEIKRKSRSQARGIPSLRLASEDVFDGVFEQIKARLDNRQKRKINETLRNLLWVSQIVLWAASLILVLRLYPQSRWLATLLLAWAKIPARILLIAGIAYVAVRISSFLIEKGVLALQEGAQWAPDQSQRLTLRFSTFSQVARGVVGTLILGVSAMFMLAAAGIEIGPLLAGAGIAGLAVSLAAQSLIKDIINGFLILFEDQFGIGDVISTGGVTGTVESLDLRITQLRDSEGRLITIPNGQISMVQNLSMDWSQVDLSVTIAHQNNLAEVLGLLRAIASDLSQEADWRRLILEPPEVLGVESLDYKGITLRLWLKTQPLKQWMVARELRKRIKYAFDEQGIEIGIPQEEITVSRGSLSVGEMTIGEEISPAQLDS